MKIRDLMFAATIGMAVSHMPHAADVQAPASELLTAGEVRKVDKDAGKVSPVIDRIASIQLIPLIIEVIAADCRVQDAAADPGDDHGLGS